MVYLLKEELPCDEVGQESRGFFKNLFRRAVDKLGKGTRHAVPFILATDSQYPDQGCGADIQASPDRRSAGVGQQVASAASVVEHPCQPVRNCVPHDAAGRGVGRRRVRRRRTGLPW